MRELEASLHHFGEFLLRARLVKERAAPYCVRWVGRFLIRPAANEPLADQVRRFCEDLESEESSHVRHPVLCREVFGVNVEDLSLTTRAKRRAHLDDCKPMLGRFVTMRESSWLQ